MKQRRIPIDAEQRHALALRLASTADEVERAANVVGLSDHGGRHRAERSGVEFPEAKNDALHVLSIGHDLPTSREGPERNQVLAGLEPASYARLCPHLEWVPLARGRVLCEAGGQPSHVYFPTSGIVSLCCELANGNAVEVALAGNDGLVGVQVLMGGGSAISRAVVRNPGFGYRLGADALRDELEACPPLRQSLLRHAQALMTQVAQTAVCHCHHQLEQQFSRLLLVSLDRMRSNELGLTQDAMASLLGARRESITVSAGTLQAAGVIRYHRGHITVLDRLALEARACECYAVVRAELDRLLAGPVRERRPVRAISRRYEQARAGVG